MRIDEIAARGLVLLGCGRMGSALLGGWLNGGIAPEAVHVLEPRPSAWLKRTGVTLNGELPEDPAVLVVAVKPQILIEAVEEVLAYGGGSSLVISIAAGTPIAAFETAFGPGTPVVRAMPNTPAAVGSGITALFGNEAVSEDAYETAETLLSAVGQVIGLDAEDQMDAVTAVSGSGPAYVFHLIEALAAAGEAEGLSPDLALILARATVAGSGALAEIAGEDPAVLRENVTSPGGTTAAGLGVLMDEAAGLRPLIARTVAAAAARSRDLRQ
ncbi:MAG: pyrroline-5-carboxylate reductase [Pseudomonadota bacterium]